jgi:hypothetical protein
MTSQAQPDLPAGSRDVPELIEISELLMTRMGARLATRTASPADDAHHALAGWHDYAAHAELFGPDVAARISGGALRDHAARLAAALADVLVTYPAPPF